MITKQNFPILMAAFCGMVEQQQHDRLAAQGFTPALHNHKVRTETGKKYVQVFCGDSGKFMVEMSTGNIFGIKGLGQIHRGHFYGTLETIGEYFWGEYYPTRLDGKLGIQKANGCPAITHAPIVEVDPQPLVPDNGGGNIGPNPEACPDCGGMIEVDKKCANCNRVFEDTVCPDGPECQDPKCQAERVKQGLAVVLA